MEAPVAAILGLYTLAALIDRVRAFYRRRARLRFIAAARRGIERQQRNRDLKMYRDLGLAPPPYLTWELPNSLDDPDPDEDE